MGREGLLQDPSGRGYGEARHTLDNVATIAKRLILETGRLGSRRKLPLSLLS